MRTAFTDHQLRGSLKKGAKEGRLKKKGIKKKCAKKKVA
jgi:hypothetical protein